MEKDNKKTHPRETNSEDGMQNCLTDNT